LRKNNNYIRYIYSLLILTRAVNIKSDSDLDWHEKRSCNYPSRYNYRRICSDRSSKDNFQRDNLRWITLAVIMHARARVCVCVCVCVRRGETIIDSEPEHSINRINKFTDRVIW